MSPALESAFEPVAHDFSVLRDGQAAFFLEEGI